MNIINTLQNLIQNYNFMVIPASFFAIVLHEMAHGYAALWLGDTTAREDGRLSLNPLRHVDWFGLLMLIFFRMGWAKPVRVDIRRFKNPKRDFALTSLAGPIMNFLLALISTFLLSFLAFLGLEWFPIFVFLKYMILVNLGLGLFNLIPIPPLDGSKVVEAFLPDKYYYQILRYERYGFLILLLVLYTGILNNARIFALTHIILAFVNLSGLLFGNSIAVSVLYFILS